MIMPDMGAADTYVGLQSINPAIKVLLSSGYGADQHISELLNRGCSGFIQKPFSMQSLSEKIEEILTRS
jgi:DNA-binding NarL/FixJ family response regulator